MSRARLFRGIAGLVAGSLALALPTATASAESASSNLDRALRHAPSATADASGSSARTVDPDTDCFGDRDDDMVISSEGADDGDPISEERADILGHCIAYGPTLSLSVDVSVPTDPFDDDAWQDATFVGWYLDLTGDDDGEFFVEASLTTDGAFFSGTMTDISDPDDPQVVCEELDTAATSSGYSVNGIPLDCFGDADTTSIWSSPAIFYDYDGLDDDGRVAFDSSPDDDDFDGPVTQSTATRSTARYAGDTREATSVAISQAQFPGTASTVYIARNGVPDGIFADAVAGGTLTDGPILLVPSCGDIPQVVLDEIERLQPDDVLALGGPVAICDQVLEDAGAAAGAETGRVAGESRFETAVEIANREFPGGSDTVYLARADVFADAAVGGTVTDGPILLVPSCGDVPQAVLDEIADQDPDDVIAFGGPVAICDPTFAQAIAAAGADVDFFRLAGETRIGTSVRISQHVFPEPGTADAPINAHLARQDLFADAIVGGVLTSGPILLVPQCGDLPSEVGSEISRLSPESVIALGGPVAVCDDILNAAATK